MPDTLFADDALLGTLAASEKLNGTLSSVDAALGSMTVSDSLDSSRIGAAISLAAAPAGIGSREAFGSPLVLVPGRIGPIGIVTSQALGTPAIRTTRGGLPLLLGQH